MYNAYGSNVYKKYQVNIGNPYKISQKKAPPVALNRNTEKEPNAEARAEEILKAARLQAEEIIEKANSEAKEILENAQQKIEAHMLEVEQRAKEEGYRTGEELARQHYQALLDEAEEMRQKSKEVYENTVLSLETEMVETILEIGRKVLSMELSTNPNVIAGLIKTALLGSSPSEEITIRVSPDDYDYVVENKDRLLCGLKNTGHISIRRDSALTKGGCLVEAGFGSVDSSLDTQMEAVERAFRELLGYSPDEASAVEACGEKHDNSR